MDGSEIRIDTVGDVRSTVAFVFFYNRHVSENLLPKIALSLSDVAAAFDLIHIAGSLLPGHANLTYIIASSFFSCVVPNSIDARCAKRDLQLLQNVSSLLLSGATCVVSSA